MIVMKFGGTSLASSARIRAAARLVLEHRIKRPVVVVSALAGTTNALEELIELAIAGRAEALDQACSVLLADHVRVLEGLAVTHTAELESQLGSEFEQLRASLDGVRLLGECSPRVRDLILSRGELISHRFMAAAIHAEGGVAMPVDPRRLLCTDEHYGEANPNQGRTNEQVLTQLAPLFEADVIPVTGGFVGSSSKGETTVLGRGGSDFSATLLALALEADEVQIWTDVDGMMTADPRVVPSARTLSELSFREACELAYFGARVLHPATIRPAIERQIPVRVRNSMHPEVPGTLIAEPPEIALPTPGTARAVAWKTGITLVSLTSGHMLGAHGFLARVFETFARHRTAVDVVTTSEVSVSLTVDRPERVAKIAHELESIGRIQVSEAMSVVCLVGCGFLEHPELLGEVLLTLRGVPLQMFCLGSSDVNLTLVVEERHAEEVVRRLHSRFLEDEPCAVRAS